MINDEITIDNCDAIVGGIEMPMKQSESRVVGLYPPTIVGSTRCVPTCDNGYC